jgi:hypothetical protein
VDVVRRLADFGMTRDQILEVVRACVSGAGNVTENDPPGTHGWETYRFGVRRFREVLRPEGWEKDNTEGLATVVNHQLRMRVAVANTDGNTGHVDKLPQNRTRKGPTAERVAVANEALLPGVEWPLAQKPGDSGPSIDGYATWHLCVYVDGDDVRVELSLLNEFESGFFTGWQERIILLGPGDWANVDLPESDDDSEPELDIDVRPR